MDMTQCARNLLCFLVKLIEVVAKDIHHDPGCVAGERLIDALGEEAVS